MMEYGRRSPISKDDAPVLSDERLGSAPLLNPSYDEQEPELLSHRSSRNSNSFNDSLVGSSWSQRGVSDSPGNFVL